jgi:hypothetical protein
MTFLPYVSLFVALTVCCSTRVLAQSPVDPSGHWEGVIQAPEMSIPFEVDFMRNAKGEIIGTINLPAERIAGLPIANVKVDGATVSFHVRADQPLTGTISADGTSITGNMAASGGTAPFTMTRTGAARIEPHVSNKPVGKALEGTWRGTLQSRMGSMKLVLEIANTADGATARLINLDQGSLTIPASTITQEGTTLTLVFKIIDGTFAGTLNAAGTELSGTISQRQGSMPLTFTREGR